MTAFQGWLAVAAAFMALVAASGVSAEDAVEKRIKAGDRDPAFLSRVDRSIERGVGFLLAGQEHNGSWSSFFDTFPGGPFTRGVTALCLFALLKSGVNRNDAVVQKGFGYLKAQWRAWCDFGRPTPPAKTAWHTYDVGTTLMALEAFYRAPAQGRVGLPKELTSAVPPKRRARLVKDDLRWMRELAAYLQEGFSYTEEKSAWSYYPAKGSSGDRSNTQFAVLGLGAAARCGVATDASIWRKVLEEFISSQQKKGEKKMPRVEMHEDRKRGYVTYRTVSRVLDEARGWAYNSREVPVLGKDEWTRPTGSMTCVGISAVMIAVNELKRVRRLPAREKALAVRAAWDGLAWLHLHFSVRKNPMNEKKWTYYYLYGLERACVLTGVRNVGPHDWYREGAEFLLRRQQGGGAWSGQETEGPVCATCFALLFLTRATTPGFVKITGKR
jgi:integrase